MAQQTALPTPEAFFASAGYPVGESFVVEDSDATAVMGYGHVEATEFAAIVNRYDAEYGEYSPSVEASDVRHTEAGLVHRQGEIQFALGKGLAENPDAVRFPVSVVTR